ncbi:FAD-dependent oxidoreductase [Turicimonas muris]|uniref:FAD-dependent oxidoreductase n=7 Tax=Turicimonas muris TaxID=1796652 RepID=UPI002617EF27|nr:flavocytochrome c [Turicimonas muris]
MTLSRRNLLKTVGLGTLATLPYMQANAAGFDKEYDVVVVGGGGAGLAAACRAGELGLKAIVLEKTGLLGGSSLLCGGQFSTFGTDLQKAKGKTDTADIFYNDMIKTGKGMNDPKVVRAFVNMSKIQYDFLTKTLDVHPRGVMAASGMSVPRSHTFKPPEVIKALTKYAKDRGVEIVLNANANRLVTECGTGRVIGVKATINKKDVVLGATKGVVLAAGGFSRNPELLAKFNPIMAKADAISGGGTQGDGILMAQAIGADTLDTTYIKASYGFKLKPTIIQDMSLITYSGAIMINKEGRRFTDESQSYKLQGDASLAQTDGYSYQVFDKNILDYDLKNDTQGVEMMTALTNDPAGQKWVYFGETIEEAAKKAGLDPKQVKETVEKYNKGIKEGKDEFGRTSLTSGFGKPVPLEKGPFYIMPTTAALIGTYCGLKINEKAQVINVFGEVIPALYAAGELTGGVHGAAYMTGTAFGKAICFGRIAIDSIAGK